MTEYLESKGIKQLMAEADTIKNIEEENRLKFKIHALHLKSIKSKSFLPVGPSCGVTSERLIFKYAPFKRAIVDEQTARLPEYRSKCAVLPMTGQLEGKPMISSPCKNCEKRHMPKDICMKGCEKIAAIQQSQNILRTPPYECTDSSDTFDCLYDSSFITAT